MLIATTDVNVPHYTKRWITVWDTETKEVVETTGPKGVEYSSGLRWLDDVANKLGQPIYSMSHEEGFHLLVTPE